MSSSTSNSEPRFLGVFNLAVAITLTGLALAIVACALALAAEPELAWIGVIGAGLCDLFDGRIARGLALDARARAFGVQIDSLADMVSFGVTPAVLLLAMTGAHPAAVIVALGFAACAAMRLAYFNIHGTTSNSGRQFYIGLPVTYAALVLPIVHLVDRALAPGIVLACATAALAVLFVTRLPVPKPRGVWYAIFPIAAVLVSAGLALTRCASG